MNPSRISLATTGRSIYRAIDALDSSVDLDPRLRELIRIRASQLNGCAYCLDLHSVDARHFDESELANLIGAIIAINAWNLVGVSTGLEAEIEVVASSG